MDTLKDPGPETVRQLVARLDAAIDLADVEHITRRIKDELQSFSSHGSDALPRSFCSPCGDAYARRLLYRHPTDAYTVVVMAWGPGQRTELHDHAGIWCVECVVEGELDVTQFDLVDHAEGRFRFEERTRVRASVGDAGCLIPPFEYHTLSNPRDDRTAVTLHVYGGEMDHCNCYRPQGAGWWERTPKRLVYTGA